MVWETANRFFAGEARRGRVDRRLTGSTSPAEKMAETRKWQSDNDPGKAEISIRNQSWIFVKKFFNRLGRIRKPAKIRQKESIFA